MNAQPPSQLERVGFVQAGPRLLLRLEGLALLALATTVYAHWAADWGMGWGIYAACFFLPDLAFAGYLAGPRVGAACYNATHSLLGAAACLALGVVGGQGLLLGAGLIWGAHIGFDRMLGYGLKYAQGFGFTHLGVVGQQAQSGE